MDEAEQQRLKQAGWKVGTVQEFLGLSDDEQRLVEKALAESTVTTPSVPERPIEPPPNESHPAKMATSDGTTSRRSLFCQPWVTVIAVVTCVIIFAGLLTEGREPDLNAFARWGYLPANSIWQGQVWALVTSVFVHTEIWHLALNLYWLWVLGMRLEQALGSLRFLAFFLASAFVSSAIQMTASDTTGIGASGVVYAIFGFMWTARTQFPEFESVLDRRTIQLFVYWLFGCLAVTLLGLFDIGNAAHFSGLFFGWAVAGYFVVRQKRRLMLAGMLTLSAVAVVPLFWCPWSVTWLGEQAYKAHVAERYDQAIQLYNQVIRRNPDFAWGYFNRGAAYQAIGKSQEAAADFARAHQLDSSLQVPDTGSNAQILPDAQ